MQIFLSSHSKPQTYTYNGNLLNSFYEVGVYTDVHSTKLTYTCNFFIELTSDRLVGEGFRFRQERYDPSVIKYFLDKFWSFSFF